MVSCLQRLRLGLVSVSFQLYVYEIEWNPSTSFFTVWIDTTCLVSFFLFLLDISFFWYQVLVNGSLKGNESLHVATEVTANAGLLFQLDLISKSPLDVSSIFRQIKKHFQVFQLFLSSSMLERNFGQCKMTSRECVKIKRTEYRQTSLVLSFSFFLSFFLSNPPFFFIFNKTSPCSPKHFASWNQFS